MSASIAPRSSKRRLNSEINVTPFVDVMLVLLVIFMVTSPMLVAGVQVNLPLTNSEPLSGQDETLVLTIEPNGNIYLQDEKVAVEELAPKLSAISGIKIDSNIFIRGDKSLNYGWIMKIFDEVKKAGYQRVSLVTEVEN